MSIYTGLDTIIIDRMDLVSGQNVGLVTNHSAFTRNMVHAVDALIASGVILTALFAPEHGIRGEAAAGAEVSSFVDHQTGIPVHSLYGTHKKPTTDMLQGLDVILFDIQDIGARFYTYLYTMSYTMQACAEHCIRFIVLDRPNPIGGLAMEGPVLDPRFASFVGMYPIPIRYGLTIGECALLFNNHFGIKSDLEVVGMKGWDRSMWYDQTGLIWVPPSPGIPTLDAAAAYPGTCLLEGTNISEGRGTSTPFQTVGAPWIDGNRLSTELNSAELSGVVFSATRFTPNASKYEGEACEGVQLHITDRESFLPVLTGVKIVELILRLWPDLFAFRSPDDIGRSFFDLLAGTDSVRKTLTEGHPAEQIASDWSGDLDAFMSVRSEYLIY